MTYDPVCQDPPSLDLAHPATRAEPCFMCCGSTVNGVLYVAQGARPHPTVGQENDHGHSDGRIALSRMIPDWLDSLPGAPSGRAGEPGPS